MKKKVGTVLEAEVLGKAKERAVRERRPLAELFELTGASQPLTHSAHC